MMKPSDIASIDAVRLIVAYVFDTILAQEVDLDALTGPEYQEFFNEIVEGIRVGLADEDNQEVIT